MRSLPSSALVAPQRVGRPAGGIPGDRCVASPPPSLGLPVPVGITNVVNSVNVVNPMKFMNVFYDSYVLNLMTAVNVINVMNVVTAVNVVNAMYVLFQGASLPSMGSRCTRLPAHIAHATSFRVQRRT